MSTLPLKVKNNRWNENTKHTRKKKIFTNKRSVEQLKFCKFSMKRKAGIGSVIVSSLGDSLKESLNQRTR